MGLSLPGRAPSLLLGSAASFHKACTRLSLLCCRKKTELLGNTGGNLCLSPVPVLRCSAGEHTHGLNTVIKLPSPRGATSTCRAAGAQAQAWTRLRDGGICMENRVKEQLETAGEKNSGMCIQVGEGL